MKRLYISMVMLFFATALTFANTPSTLVNTQCNRGVSVSSLIYCYIKPDAVAYLFEVSDELSTRYHEVDTNKFKLSDLNGGADYSTTYEIRVATRKEGGSFGDFGSTCSVTTWELYQTQLAICDQKINNFDSYIYCGSRYVDGYQFQIVHNGQVYEIENELNRFRLSDVLTVQEEKTYEVRVRFKYKGVFQPYGPKCTVRTEKLNKMLDRYCDVTLTSINNSIYAYRYDDSSEYGFKITEGTNTLELNLPTNRLNLIDHLSQVKSSTEYSIQVRNKYGDAWSSYGTVCRVITPEFTVIVPTQCGKEVASVNSLIYCYIKQDTDQYTFEVSDGSTTETFVTNTNKFRLADLESTDYGKTYTIRVAIRQNGVQGDFGRPCSISVPPLPTTQLVSTQCNKELSDVNSMIYCYIKPDVEEYLFEINNGSSTIQHPVQINKFKLTDIPDLANYNKTYSIRVATKVNGRLSAFGALCTITTPASPPVPLNALLPQFCNISLKSNYEVLYCSRNLNAEAYRFKISEGGQDQIYESSINKFRLAALESIKYDTQYSIEVSTKFFGVWTDYGEACTVKSPVRTKLVNTQCDKELKTLYQPIYCYIKPNVEEYTFEVNNGAQIRTYTSSSNKFDLSKVLNAGSVPDPPGVGSFVEYEKDYKIRVAIKEEGKEQGGFGDMCIVKTPIKPKSKLTNDWCGKEITSIDTWIYCYRYDAASKYRFEVIDDWGSKIITTNTNKFKFSDLGEVSSEWIYYVRVSVMYHGQWVDYGDLCTVIAPKQSHLVDNQCGGQLSSIDGWIYAYIRPDVDMYTFEVTNGNEVRTFTTDTNKFKLSDLDGGGKFEQTYSVRVALTTGGVQGEFGKSCNISTPIVPTTQIVSNQCGATLSKFDDVVYCESVAVADGYRFTLSYGAYEKYTRVTTSNSIRLSEMVSLTPNRTYTMKVDVRYNNQFYEGGKTCNISTPNFSKIYTIGASVEERIYAVQANNVDEYVFEVFDGESTYIYTNTYGNFTLTKDKGAAIHKDYEVRVALKQNGIIGDYGPKQILKIRPRAMYIIPSSCGKTHYGTPYSQNQIWAVQYGSYGERGYSDEYEFEFKNDNITEVRTSNYNAIYARFLMGSLPTGEYQVRVRAKYGEFWMPWSPYCTINYVNQSGYFNRPSISVEKKEDYVTIKSYPNPFTDTFQISYPTDSEGTVSVSIFDMSGRQVAQSQHEAATLSEQYFGQGLSAGIYNVILEHGTEVRTLRVIKQ